MSEGLIDIGAIFANSGLNKDEFEVLEVYAKTKLIESGVDDSNFLNVLLYAFDQGLITFNHEAISVVAVDAQAALLGEQKLGLENKILAIDAKLKSLVTGES